MRFTRPIAALVLAAAGISSYALTIDGAHANGRIIDATSPDRSTHNGRILYVTPPSQEEKTDRSPVIVTPRPWYLPPDLLPRDRDDDIDAFDEDALPERPSADRDRATVVVVNRFLDDACYSGGSVTFRAGDRFQAGGNMLRVPAEEDRFGRHACNQTRLFQRYLGFKRVYKGQVYTGFRKVYSGPRYLSGDY